MLLLGTLANKVVLFTAYRWTYLLCRYAEGRERETPSIYQEASVFFSRSVTVFMQQRYYLLVRISVVAPKSVLQGLSRQLSEIIYCEELGCRIMMFSRDEKERKKGEVVIAPLE